MHSEGDVMQEVIGAEGCSGLGGDAGGVSISVFFCFFLSGKASLGGGRRSRISSDRRPEAQERWRKCDVDVKVYR